MPLRSLVVAALATRARALDVPRRRVPLLAAAALARPAHASTPTGRVVSDEVTVEFNEAALGLQLDSLARGRRAVSDTRASRRVGRSATESRRRRDRA